MRVCIFSLDDSYPTIDEEKIYLLNHIKECVDYLMIICNVSFQEYELKKLTSITAEVYENISGFDANRWKHGIEILNADRRFAEIEELVLINDSFFGPLYPLQDVFCTMEKRAVDFWGLTVHGKMPRKTTFRQREKCWDRFLQTYFLCFNKNVLQDSCFLKFWEKVPIFNNFDEYEEKFEFVLTKYFAKKFKWEPYADTSMWEAKEADKFMSFILFQPCELIRQKKLPVLSKFAVTIDKKAMLNFHLGEQISQALNYIDLNTDYDIKFIYAYLIRRVNLYDLKQSLNLNFVLPDNNHSAEEDFWLKKRRVAVFAHLYYEELFDYCLSYLVPLSKMVDIYITTGDEKSKVVLQTKLAGNNHTKKIEVSTYQGREWAAFLLIDRKYMKDYDYCCLIHDKKSSQMFYPTVGKSFCDNLWENSLKSLEYVNSIIDVFEKKEFVGLMTPPDVYHGTYFHTAINFWTICFEGTKQLLEKLNIYVPLDPEKPPVAVGSAFWCRSKAVEKLIEMDIKEEDFPQEPLPVDGSFNHCLERAVPYMVQDSGYYTCNIMTQEYASMNLTNYQEMWRQIMKLLKENSKLNFATFQSCVESLEKHSS